MEDVSGMAPMHDEDGSNHSSISVVVNQSKRNFIGEYILARFKSSHPFYAVKILVVGRFHKKKARLSFPTTPNTLWTANLETYSIPFSRQPQSSREWPLAIKMKIRVNSRWRVTHIGFSCRVGVRVPWLISPLISGMASNVCGAGENMPSSSSSLQIHTSDTFVELRLAAEFKHLDSQTIDPHYPHTWLRRRKSWSYATRERGHSSAKSLRYNGPFSKRLMQSIN